MNKRTFIFVILGIGVCIADLGISVYSQKKSTAPSKPKVRMLPQASDRTKAQIIRPLLSNIRKDDAAISEDGNLYLYISESLYNLLPKTLNGITVKLLPDLSKAKEHKQSFMTFHGWSMDGNKVFLTYTTNFWDGNDGGCDCTFVRKRTRWHLQKSNCFASAS